MRAKAKLRTLRKTTKFNGTVNYAGELQSVAGWIYVGDTIPRRARSDRTYRITVTVVMEELP